LEYITDSAPHNTNFVDLFVKVTNSLAIQLYEKLGYNVFRRVVGYYGTEDDEYPTNTSKLNDLKDAFDMRKGMKRDGGRCMAGGGRDNRCLPHEVVF
jgi:N-terminal acetyltransferase B complex catalytic subunit